MARKKITRTLGQLPAASALGAREHRTDRLLEILRGVAVKNQQNHSRVFYSVRDVATRFRVPVSTVSQIYGQLEKEGILSRVRSSRTILQGLHYDRRLSVRAFVGLPASESAFVTLQEYRMFFIRIRRELRLRGFATGMVFFRPEELKTSTLCDRLKTYQVDTVVWFLPPTTAKDTIPRLSDLGIRVLGVAEGHGTAIRCRYEVRRETAIRRLLNEWKSRHSIDRVTLVESRDRRSPVNEAILEALLDEVGIEPTIATFKSQRIEPFLRGLQKSKTGSIIFSSATLVSMFCFRRPGAVTELLQAQRVAFVDGAVNMPFAKVPDVRVDLITVNWQLVAEAIVDDLITQEAFKRAGPTIFEAEPHLHVPLNQFAQSI
jgi:hypothetical protein